MNQSSQQADEITSELCTEPDELKQAKCRQVAADIRLGDCLEVLKSFNDNTFDFIVTSPPYADRRGNRNHSATFPRALPEWFLLTAA